MMWIDRTYSSLGFCGDRKEYFEQLNFHWLNRSFWITKLLYANARICIWNERYMHRFMKWRSWWLLFCDSFGWGWHGDMETTWMWIFIWLLEGQCQGKKIVVTEFSWWWWWCQLLYTTIKGKWKWLLCTLHMTCINFLSSIYWYPATCWLQKYAANFGLCWTAIHKELG